MNIWLVMSGEPLEQFEERPHRIGILSKMLVELGHEVTWWTTSYDHQYKKYLYEETTEVKNKFGINMIFLHSSTPYIKNISFNRMKNHREVAIKFRYIASQKKKPDIILSAFPTIDLANEAVIYGKKSNIPTMIDIRDLWPQIFFDPFPKILYPFMKIFLSNYIKQTKNIFSSATVISGVSEKYLQYGLEYVHRKKTQLDRVYPLAYHKIQLEDKIYEECKLKFKELGIDTTKKIVWFVGTFGQTYDLTLVIDSIKNISDLDNVQFVFTGDGEKAEEWKKLSKNIENIKFTGWVNQDDLLYLANIADIGLMAYRKGAPQGLPNKIFEYMAFGLPILSSLEGETATILHEEKIGFTYSNKKDFEKYLMKILKDENLYNNFSKNAEKVYNENFSAKKVYGEMIEHLKIVVKEYKNV